MNLKEKVREVAGQKHISMAQLERDLGFGNGTITKWDKQSPSTEKIEKVANYLNVSVDYLLGRKASARLDVDLEKALDNAMTYEGRPLTDEERAAMKEILKAYLKTKK